MIQPLDDRHAPHVRRVGLGAGSTWLMAVAAASAGAAWIGLKALICWNERGGEAAQLVCGYGFVIPDALWMVAAVLFALTLWSLRGLGARLADAPAGAGASTAMRHTRHAYRSLAHPHRRRVKGAAASTFLCTALFTGVAAWYVFELPPAAALALIIVLTVGAYLAAKASVRTAPIA
jgi:hypothetical protein